MVSLQGPVDLRSDTVTRPSPGMRAAMAEAPVGDDVYREDPTMERLQEQMAGLLGKEAALFVPSGTMGNQLCLRTLTRCGDEVIVHEDAHVLHYEGGSAAALSGLQLRPLPGRWGVLDPESVVRAVRPGGEHVPRTGAVEMENTHNRCGGTLWSVEQMRAVAEVARARDLVVHLDGARLWNASAATGTRLRAYAAWADSVSVCFSKGLGAPVGSVLAGSRAFVEEARINRKRYGGAMRQAGILAAGALYAIEHNVERLVEDHENARVLGEVLGSLEGLQIIHPVQSNIVVADVGGLGLDASRAVTVLAEAGVLCGAPGPNTVRFVTHLDVDIAQVCWAAETAVRVLDAAACRRRQV